MSIQKHSKPTEHTHCDVRDTQNRRFWVLEPDQKLLAITLFKAGMDFKPTDVFCVKVLAFFEIKE